MIKPSITQTRAAVAALGLSASVLVGIGMFEGFRDTAYIPVPGDKPTYGMGATIRPDGKPVRLGDTITPERALMLLNNQIEGTVATPLKRCITVPLHTYEFGALVMLAYNVGAPTVCKKAAPGKPPNLIDLINTQQYAAACERIEAFNKGPGGKVLPGLVNRRKIERAKCEGKLE